MVKNIIIYAFAIFWGMILLVNAQEQPKVESEEINENSSEVDSDTTEVDNDWDDFIPEDKGLDFSFAKNSLRLWDEDDDYYKAPFIDASFGYSLPYYDKPYYMDNFGQIGITEIKLGTEKQYNLNNAAYVFRLETDYIGVANAKEEYYNPDITDGEISTEFWAIDLAEFEGYGYKFHKNFKMVLYEGAGFTFNHLNFNANGYSNGIDTIRNTPQVFGKQVRVGRSYTAGTKFQLFETLNLGAEYTNNQVFPRWMFWYWTLDTGIELITEEILEEFIEEIEESSPYLVPIINIALKTGLRYGLYELRKDDMNWPINTASPFMIESFKISAGLNF